MSRSFFRLLLIFTLLSASYTAQAAKVLVVTDEDHTGVRFRPEFLQQMRNDGHNVTFFFDFPRDAGGGQVELYHTSQDAVNGFDWVLYFTDQELEPIEGVALTWFLNQGGYVYVQMESDCCDNATDAAQRILRANVLNGADFDLSETRNRGGFLNLGSVRRDAIFDPYEQFGTSAGCQSDIRARRSRLIGNVEEENILVESDNDKVIAAEFTRGRNLVVNSPVARLVVNGDLNMLIGEKEGGHKLRELPDTITVNTGTFNKFFPPVGASFATVACEEDFDNVSCADGLRNQDETDVDCGGENCNECRDTDYCILDRDCDSDVCTIGICRGGRPALTESLCIGGTANDLHQPGEGCDEGPGGGETIGGDQCLPNCRFENGAFCLEDIICNSGYCDPEEQECTDEPDGLDRDGDGVEDDEDSAPNDPCVPSATAGTCDQDDDGLTNDEEADAGTNPTNPDSDGDDFTDGEEVEAGTDPNNENSNPTSVDSDGDGVNDNEDSAPNNACIPDASHPNCDRTTVDNDRDGSDASTDPDDNNPCVPSQDAPTCDRDGDGLTNEQEANLGSNPAVADTDGDTLNDRTEIEQGSSPTDPCDPDPNATACQQNLDEDTDNDGLTAAEEIAAGTNPNNPDSDNDGYCDGDLAVANVCIANDTEPTNPCEPNPNANACSQDNQDSDNDGLTDAEERQLGTDPNDRDSDDDGLTD